MRVFMFGCCLLITLLIGFPKGVEAGPNNQARIALKLATPTSKNACETLESNCWSFDVQGQLYPQWYFAYVLVTGGDADAGISGVQFGIDYQGGLSTGQIDQSDIDIYSWTLCAELQHPMAAWPAPGSGNLIVWNTVNNCQDGVPGGSPQGVTSVLGYFYCAAYTAGTLAIGPHPANGLALVVSCDAEPDTISNITPSRLAVAAFSDGAAEEGYNPCPAPPTTTCGELLAPGHGNLSATFRHAFRLQASESILGDTTTSCVSNPRDGWTFCQFDSVAKSVIRDSSGVFLGFFPKLVNYFDYRDADSRVDYIEYVGGMKAGTTRRLDIRLEHDNDCQRPEEGAGGTAREDYVQVWISDPSSGHRQSARELLNGSTIAHEIGHLLANGNLVRAEGMSSANEWYGVVAEYVAGDRWQGRTYNFPHDMDISLFTGGPSGDVSEEDNTRYDEYRLFTDFLMYQFPGPTSDPRDDLLSQLARNLLSDLSPPGTYPRFDLYGLSRYLDDSALSGSLQTYYRGRLESEDGDERVGEIFNRFGVARFLDDKSGVVSTDYAFSPTVSSWQDFGLFIDTSDPDSHDVAALVPPEISLDSGFLQSGIYRYEGEWTSPLDAQSVEPIGLPSWSTDYVVIRPTWTSPVDLTIRLEMCNQQPLDRAVFLNAITYDVNEDELYRKGAHALQVQTVKAVTEPCMFNRSFIEAALEVENVGGTAKAIVLTISLADNVLDQYGITSLSLVPYRLTISTAGQPGMECPLLPPSFAWTAGSNSSTQPYLEYVLDVAGSGSNVFCADAGGEKVVRLSSSGALIDEWAAPGYPQGLTVQADSVFVAAGEDKKVRIYEFDGDLLGQWGTAGSAPSQFIEPIDVAVSPSGHNIYVLDHGALEVKVFQPNGTFVRYWGESGHDPGMFSNPTSIAVSDAGDVYVADSGNHRIQRFSSTGSFELEFGVEGTDCSEFGGSLGITINDEQVIHVVDAEIGRIQMFDLNGSYRGTYVKPGSSNGRILGARGIANSTNHVFVADTGNFRIQGFEYPISSHVDMPTELPAVRMTASPNPFGNSVRIMVRTPAGSVGETKSHLVVELFDVAGRHITTLADHDVVPGEYSIDWDGQAKDGSSCPNGIYFVRSRWNGVTIEAQKLIRLR